MNNFQTNDEILTIKKNEKRIFKFSKYTGLFKNLY